MNMIILFFIFLPLFSRKNPGFVWSTKPGFFHIHTSKIIIYSAAFRSHASTRVACGFTVRQTTPLYPFPIAVRVWAKKSRPGSLKSFIRATHPGPSPATVWDFPLQSVLLTCTEEPSPCKVFPDKARPLPLCFPWLNDVINLSSKQKNHGIGFRRLHGFLLH